MQRLHLIKKKGKYEAKDENKEAKKRDKERSNKIAEHILQDKLHHCHEQIKSLKKKSVMS
jgi:hypothetical protein